MPIVLPKISPCGEPRAGWCAAQEPPRNAVTASNSRRLSASIVAKTYSAIAGSWPKTLHSPMPRGRDGRSIMSTPAVAACSSLSRGASGKSDRQICPTTISASASAGISRCMSVSSARMFVSSFSVILPRMRGATRAASPPRNSVFMANGQSSNRRHDIDQRVATHEAVDVVRHLVPAPPDHAGSPARAMRRHDDIRQFVKWVSRWAALRFGRARVLPPDIDRGASDRAIAQRRVKRVLVDDRATRDVDEKRRALHRPKPAGIDQPLSLRAECGADRHRVAERQHLVERRKRVDPLDAVTRRTRAAIGGQYMTAES